MGRVFLHQDIEDAFTAFEQGEGDPTLVNGVATVAHWVMAQPGRVQMFLTQDEWAKPAYEVLFTAAVLGAPWSIANAVPVVWQTPANAVPGDPPWTGDVRNIKLIAVDGTVMAVDALVVLTEAE